MQYRARVDAQLKSRRCCRLRVCPLRESSPRMCLLRESSLHMCLLRSSSPRMCLLRDSSLHTCLLRSSSLRMCLLRGVARLPHRHQPKPAHGHDRHADRAR